MGAISSPSPPRRSSHGRRRAPTAAWRGRLVAVAVLLCAACGAQARGTDADEADGADADVICRRDEDECPGGVIVQTPETDRQCWRVGARGQSCEEVCGMREMVDLPGTRSGSGMHEIIDCIEDELMPGLKERACPPSSDIGIGVEECTRARRQGFRDEGRGCGGSILLVDVIEHPRWHCYPRRSLCAASI